MINLQLKDTQWPLDFIDHERRIVRAIVLDDQGFAYFVRAQRDDDFGKATFIETSGGGVEANESLEQALHRELREELGVEVEILEKLGYVEDYYNLIHRKNLNHYYLCRILSFKENQLTKEEKEEFHLQTFCLPLEEAIQEYESCSKTAIGQLIYQREVPILKEALQRKNGRTISCDFQK